MVKKVIELGSVRVDLLGGTIDLNPINLVLPNVMTLNLATSLKAKVEISEVDFPGVIIFSKDYNVELKIHSYEFNVENFNSDFFGNFKFIAEILNVFNLHSGISLLLESGSPAGAGLGGSSAMGMTLYKAISKFLNLEINIENAIKIVNSLEAKILDCGPAGYQDYYPAMYGGILALKANPKGVLVEQLYSDDLKNFLESHLTLVYSGDTRLSGINNWEVYKAFFNKEGNVRNGLNEIAELSYKTYFDILNKDFSKVLNNIALEGEVRKKLFPGILTPSMNELSLELKKLNLDIGMKVCGAGGGGCFIITHKKENAKEVLNLVEKYKMRRLEFQIEKPLV